jgi:hypothetical protein
MKPKTDLRRHAAGLLVLITLGVLLVFAKKPKEPLDISINIDYYINI